MTALSITASEVTTTNTAPIGNGIAYTAINAGDAVFIDTANGNKINLADADVLASSIVCGIALNSASAGQPVSYAKTGAVITVTTSTFTKGTPYFLGTTAGDIVPFADLASGDYVSYLGVAKTTTTFAVNIHNTEVTI